MLLCVMTVALGSQPRQGHGKVRAKNATWESHSHSQECRRMWMNDLTHSQMDSQIFRGWFKGSKLIGLKTSLYHWKALRPRCFKWARDPFEYLHQELWPKERTKVKISILLSTIRSWKSPLITCVKVACHISLKRSWLRLQLSFRPHLNQRLT
jgi:hypothetical protein